MEGLCRTCLLNSFALEPLVADVINKIQILSSIEVDETDSHPKKICKTCIDKLNEYYAFRGHIIESDKYFKQCANIKIELEDHPVLMDYGEFKGHDPNLTNLLEHSNAKNPKLENQLNLQSAHGQVIIENDVQNLNKENASQNTDSSFNSPQNEPISYVNCEFCNKRLKKRGLKTHMTWHKNKSKTIANCSSKLNKGSKQECTESYKSVNSHLQASSNNDFENLNKESISEDSGTTNNFNIEDETVEQEMLNGTDLKHVEYYKNYNPALLADQIDPDNPKLPELNEIENSDFKDISKDCFGNFHTEYIYENTDTSNIKIEDESAEQKMVTDYSDLKPVENLDEYESLDLNNPEKVDNLNSSISERHIQSKDVKSGMRILENQDRSKIILNNSQAEYQNKTEHKLESFNSLNHLDNSCLTKEIECGQQEECDESLDVNQKLDKNQVKNGQFVNCDVCNKLVLRRGLVPHMRSHKNKRNEKGLFFCRCGYETAVEAEVIDHRKRVAHLRNCPYCPFKPEKQYLYSHIRTHLTEEEKKQGYSLCQFCKFKTNNNGEFATHKMSHEKEASCKICGILGSRRYIYGRHNRVHQKKPSGKIIVNGENLFVCAKCDFSSQNEEEYKIHKKTHVERTICTICGADVTKYNIHQHMKIHTQEKVTCEICLESVSSSSLRVHKQRHQEEENTCQICGQKFNILSVYKSHLRIHRRGLKPRNKRCTVCNKLFTDDKSLIRHQRTHTGERPHTCEDCGKHFFSKSVLKTHRRQHTKECPFVCQLCPMAFPQKVSLKTHLKSKHNSTLLQDNTVAKISEDVEIKA